MSCLSGSLYTAADLIYKASKCILPKWITRGISQNGAHTDVLKGGAHRLPQSESTTVEYDKGIYLKAEGLLMTWMAEKAKTPF